MDRVREALRELVAVFQRASSKHEANRAAAPIMEQLTREPAFFTAVIEKYLATTGSLDRRN